MKSYQYTAVKVDGQKVEGSLKASSKKMVVEELRSQGLFPVDLTEKQHKEVRKGEQRSMKGSEVILFSEELAQLLGAGLPLEPALASMAGRDEDGVIKQTAARLRLMVADGEEFNLALAKISGKFDSLYCNLVAAGEASGSLPQIIASHARYLKKRAALRNKTILALVYPVVLILACFGVALVFIFFLLPMIATMLEASPDQEVPTGLKSAMWFGDFLKAQWPVLLTVFAVFLILFKLVSSRPRTKLWLDEWKLKWPFFGRIENFAFYVQWLQTLGGLLANGMPLVEALKLAQGTVENRFCRNQLQKVTDKVEGGYSLTLSMKDSGLFPSTMTDLVAVGETTGQMSQAVDHTAEHFDSRLQNLLAGLMNVITIGVLLVMAALVLVLCYTMLQAIYGSMGSMKN